MKSSCKGNLRCGRLSAEAAPREGRQHALGVDDVRKGRCAFQGMNAGVVWGGDWFHPEIILFRGCKIVVGARTAIVFLNNKISEGTKVGARTDSGFGMRGHHGFTVQALHSA